jgi:hypothetical protein
MYLAKTINRARLADMQGTTRLRNAQLLTGAVCHRLVIVSIIGLALLGQVVPEQAGWALGGPDPEVSCDIDIRKGHAIIQIVFRRQLSGIPWALVVIFLPQSNEVVLPCSIATSR